VKLKASEQLKLSREERKAIYRGERKLRRLERPDINDGDTLIVAWSRGGKRVVDRETGEVAEVVRRPTIWLKFKEPEELEDGEWLLKYAIHDEREVTRMLGSGGSSNSERELGLNTRWRRPESVPDRKKQAARLEQFTPETERGYVSGGRVVDHLTCLGDDDLAILKADADARWMADHPEEAKAEKLRRLSNKARRLQREAERKNVDITADLEVFIARTREAIVDAKNVSV